MIDPDTVSALNNGEFIALLNQWSPDEDPILYHFVQYLSGTSDSINHELNTRLEHAVLDGDWKSELETTILLISTNLDSYAMHELDDLIEQADLLISMHHYPSSSSERFWYQLYLLSRLKIALKKEDFYQVKQEIEKLEPIYATIKINKVRHDYLQYCGILYFNLGEYNKSLSYFHEILAEEDLITGDRYKEILEFISPNYLNKGHLNISLYYYHRLLEFYDEKSECDKITQVLRQIAMIHLSKAEYGSAVETLDRCVEISKQSGDKFEQNWNQFHLAITQYQQGNWDTAANTFLSLKEVLDSSNEKLLLGLIEKFLGNIHRLRGDLTQSKIHYHQSIALLGLLDDEWNQAETYNKLGLVEFQQGEFQKAHKSFQKSLAMYTKLGARLQSADPIFNLIRIKLELHNTHQIPFYLELLQNISQSTENQTVKLTYLIAKALVLKQNKRLVEKVDALKILQDVVKQPTLDAELHILAMVHLSELLLSELLLFQNPEVLLEIELLSDQLMKIANEQKSTNFQIDTLLLQSKLALIRGSAEKSLSKLDKARHLAEEKNLKIKVEKITEEQEHLNNQLSMWDELSAKNASIRKRMELTNIENYIDSLLS